MIKLLASGTLMIILMGGLPEEPDVALWLARSCVSEAGFDSGATGECAAIAHVYAKRAERSGREYYKIMRQYSAGIKYRAGHSRDWVFDLRRSAKRPHHWPARASWPHFKKHWVNTLQMCDHFVDGSVADPLPKSDHFGGRMDAWRATQQGWRAIPHKTFKNIFYAVR